MAVNNSDIIALFENIATTHPLIAHDPVEANSKIRFWRFDPAELVGDERSKLNFDALMLGLSLPKQNSVSWVYRDTGTAEKKNKTFPVAVIGKYNAEDYTAQNTVFENAEKVLDDIAMWIRNTASLSAHCTWPVIDLIDLDNIVCRRVDNVGVTGMCGAVMTLTLAEYQVYSNANPLNDMTP